ncbi:transposase [Paraburkholderia sp.]|uniref:transposase n=1 Tax=Paraburkholderia sp. TaxID=1926495 RepID=UPI003C7A4AA5
MTAAYKPLTHLEWEKVYAFFEYEKQLHGRPRLSVRATVDAVLHVLTVKCGWYDMPRNCGYPSYQTARRRHEEWKDSGALGKAMAVLNAGGRQFQMRPAIGVVKQPSALLPVAKEPEETPVGNKEVVYVPTLFRAAETLEAMQTIARARMMEGKPANWKVRDEETA